MLIPAVIAGASAIVALRAKKKKVDFSIINGDVRAPFFNASGFENNGPKTDEKYNYDHI